MKKWEEQSEELEKILKELELIEELESDVIMTYTAACNEFFTIVCC